MGHSKKSAKQILENVQNENEMFRGSGDYRGMVEEREEEEVRHFFQLSALNHFCSYVTKVTNGSSYQKPTWATLSTRGIY